MANIGYIQVTRQCNQSCRFCSNPPTGIHLSFERAKELIDDFAGNPDYSGVILSGGEPTMSDILPEIAAYCSKAGLHSTLITNGQKIADMDYLLFLRDTGLRHFVVSLYSVNPDTQGFLTGNPDSFDNIVKALDNIQKAGLRADLGSVINKYNADHLSKNVEFIVDKFPFISHFIWNGMDPVMNRVAENPDTIPALNDFQLELYRAVEILFATGRTFRISRTPLCYMTDFEFASTETRKIVKNEERTTHFLDEKGSVRQKEFKYGKCDKCTVCMLDDICAGLYSIDVHYHSKELYPVFIPDREKQAIIRRILDGN